MHHFLLHANMRFKLRVFTFQNIQQNVKKCRNKTIAKQKGIWIDNLYLISAGTETKQTACYDIDVEVDDTLKTQMNNFLLSTASQQEIQSLDNKIHETVETINQLKTNREFFLSFAKDPQQFINKWIISQTRDLKTMTDVVGNPEEERRAEFYYQPWAQEAVCRYFYTKVQQKRAELEQALGIRNS